tara:strand:- start:201 stop:575 length:375 start_codon:yes stop_codon:yes gene_type:complete
MSTVEYQALCEMRPKSPIHDIDEENWNYGKRILKGMKIEDIIVHSKKKWVLKNNHTEVEGLLVYMLKYEYDEYDEKKLYKIIALINEKRKDRYYADKYTFKLCDYINRKPSAILSKIITSDEEL